MSTKQYLSGTESSTKTGLAYWWSLVKGYIDNLIGTARATVDSLPDAIVTEVGTTVTANEDNLQFSLKKTTKDSSDCYGEDQSLTMTFPAANSSAGGIMSKTDYNKLAGIEEGANNYVLPAATNDALGGVKIGYSGDYEALILDSDSKAYVEVLAINPDDVKNLF